jgi:tetratricopeptide (TPR) repeat protein
MVNAGIFVSEQRRQKKRPTEPCLAGWRANFTVDRCAQPCKSKNMKKNLILLFIISFLITNCRTNDTVILLPEKQSQELNNIKTEYSAEYIRTARVEEANSEKPINNSILIDILNSQCLSINDPHLKKYCDQILVEFLKACQPESKYEIIEIRFSKGVNLKLYHDWSSNGFIYSKELIENIIKQLHSPKQLLESAYLKYNQQGNYDSIIAYMNGFLNDHPLMDTAIKFRAIANYKLNQLDKAEKDFLLARSLNNIDIDNPMNLAILYGDQGKYKRGLAYIDTVLTIKDDYPKAVYYRGIYTFKLGDKENSLKYLKRAEELGVSEATSFMKLQFKE